MLKRNDYLIIIEEIRNTEQKSLDDFIEKVLEPLRAENTNLIETLYKDIHYLIKDIGKPGEGDLFIENGDLIIENNDLKLTGYQTRLHSLSLWLHYEIIKKFMNENPDHIEDKLKNFEINFLDKPNYTPEYREKLNKIKKSLREERKLNLNDKENFWDKVFDWDNLELKPNIGGIGINLNKIINKFKKSQR